MTKQFILDDKHNVVPFTAKWIVSSNLSYSRYSTAAEWIVDNSDLTRIGYHKIKNGNKWVEVKTDFICAIDTTWLFETCLFFSDVTSEVIDIYQAWDDAVEGHRRCVNTLLKDVANQLRKNLRLPIIARHIEEVTHEER